MCSHTEEELQDTQDSRSMARSCRTEKAGFISLYVDTWLKQKTEASG